MSEAILPGSSASGGSNIWEHIGTYQNTDSSCIVNGDINFAELYDFLIITIKINISVQLIVSRSEYYNFIIYESTSHQWRGIDRIDPHIYYFTLYRITNVDTSNMTDRPFMWLDYNDGTQWVSAHFHSGECIVRIQEGNNPSVTPSASYAGSIIAEIYGMRGPFTIN